MKANMGSTDRIIRILLAVIIAVLYFTNVIHGTLGTILLVFAFVLLVTSLFSFCPLYIPLSMNTKKKEK